MLPRRLLVRKHQSLDEHFLKYATIASYFIPAAVVGATLAITVGYYDRQALIKDWTQYDGELWHFQCKLSKTWAIEVVSGAL